MLRLIICACMLLFVTGIVWTLIGHFTMPVSSGGDGPIYDSVRRPALYTAALQLPADSLCVVKHLRELYVFRKGKLLKIYRVALGDEPVGHKHIQGDEKTPEGLYFIDGKNPLSSCHKNLGISYPNAADRAYAKQLGQPAGGDIKIHGLPNGKGYVGAGHLADDWTNGCVAVTDEEIDELYRYVRIGVPVLIVP